MLGFKSFIKKPLYVSRPLLNHLEFAAWMKTQGFPAIIQDLHVTVAYSSTPLKWPSPETNEIKVFASGNREIKQLGDCYVMTFPSPELNTRWKSFIAKGASWDHKAYQSHISISYKAPKGNPKPFPGTLIFGPEVFKELERNYRSKIKES